MYKYHIFFIHSSVAGHLGSFHSLAIVSNSAINIEVHVSFEVPHKIIVQGHLGGSVCLRLGSWSQDPVIKPHIWLPAQQRACFSLSHSPCLCSLSRWLSLSVKWINKILKKKSLYGLPPFLFLSYYIFPSLPLCSSVLFLKFHTWVKSYSVFLFLSFFLFFY